MIVPPHARTYTAKHRTGTVVLDIENLGDLPQKVYRILEAQESYLKNKEFTIMMDSEYTFGPHMKRNYYISFNDPKEALAFKLRI